jgi:hypothetical protein
MGQRDRGDEERTATKAISGISYDRESTAIKLNPSKPKMSHSQESPVGHGRHDRRVLLTIQMMIEQHAPNE